MCMILFPQCLIYLFTDSMVHQLVDNSAHFLSPGDISMLSPAVPSAVMNTYWPQDHGIKILRYGILPLVSIGTKALFE